MRRTKTTGALYRRRSDARWVGVVEVPRLRGEPRRRKTVTSMRFCEALRAFTAISPAPKVIQRSIRSKRLEDARARGAHTVDEWRAYVFSKGHVCEYCGYRCPGTTKDHRQPISRGGSDAIENIAVACQRCNSLKGNLTEDEFRALCDLASLPRPLPVFRRSA